MKAEARGRRDLQIVLDYLLGASSAQTAARYGVSTRSVTDKMRRFRDGCLPIPEGAAAERLRQLGRTQRMATARQRALDPEGPQSLDDIDLPIRVLIHRLDAVRELGLGDLIGRDTIGAAELDEVRSRVDRVLARHGVAAEPRGEVDAELTDWYAEHKSPWSRGG